MAAIVATVDDTQARPVLSPEEEALTILRRREDAPRIPRVTFLRCSSDRSLPNGLYPYQQHVRDVLGRMQEEPCNLLVASPTGSGKSFAIYEAARLTWACPGRTLLIGQPLIALAEQIYAALGGVKECRLGLRTGPSVRGDRDQESVIVCTYEVLARMAAAAAPEFQASTVVVIDEIHYIASERGPVLQEILQQCRQRCIVGLSGTLPNQKQFAEFLAGINTLRTYVTGAKGRPVPLSFSFYDVARQRCSVLRYAHGSLPPISPDAIGGLRSRQQLLACARHLLALDGAPMLFVVFSCKRLDDMAEWASSALDLLTASEKSRVTVMFARMLRGVPEEDRCLFTSLREKAVRGIGEHHSQLPVPYLELVCRLAEHRLLKLVFSSSTLSAGINLPVRTVVICAAKMPQRDSTGEMRYDTISPLLFNQLAGRAGRPGLEAEGFCTIVGHQAESYASAQGLVQRAQPAVEPFDELTPGDVLRGLRMHRNVGFDRALFSDPRLQEQVRFAQWTQCATQEWMLRMNFTQQDKTLARCVATAVRTVTRNETYAPLALEPCEEGATAPQRVLCLGPLGEIEIREACAEAQEEGWKHIPLCCAGRKGRAPKIPMQHLAEILETRRALQTLRREEYNKLILVAASLEIACLSRWEACGQSPLVKEEARLRAAFPSEYVSEGSTLTALGIAACEIRSISDPVALLQTLLGAGALSPEAIISICSAALGDRRTSASASYSNALLQEWPGLSALGCFSDECMTSAVATWASGATLALVLEEHASCSVGAFCRHVVRVADILEELRQAFRALEVESMVEACTLAQARICRGLPFVRRGSGRVEYGDEE